ncbi:sulfur carrier protein ThiS [Selenihalanaerobacter shriftii]|uniref:Sulfur carrier protein n=1 Tax=Selenihalanaerobacter shriftii TaxID=142842 RepID=A0A1T4NH33_9FIRM|nr:sulfur carrier protein ThiS [Selenihalanaerobacter shriftii]SJZ78641.1 sulfur carrier protein [Selenihalanaerobacter shriftii]
MKIVLNGEELELDKELTIEELLKKEDVDMPEMVSVELNGEILVREEFKDQIVKGGDKVEFLYFMGGGTSEF